MTESELQPDYVCPECFAHPWLREYVADESTRRGQCPSCDCRNQSLIPVVKLYDSFHNLISSYTPADEFYPTQSGRPIVELIQDDWNVFSDRLTAQEREGLILEAIMESGWDDDSGELPVTASDFYVDFPWTHETLAEIWEYFAEDVKQNPERPLKFRDKLFDEFLIKEEIFGRRIVSLSTDSVLYRARPGYKYAQDGIRPYRGSEIKAPPPEKATAGRANTEGTVVLYIAEQERTAVAEMRPGRGEYVSVVPVYPNKNLDILDLVAAPAQPNPFTDEDVRYSMEFRGLLMAFGEQLAKPLRARNDTTEYIPSQKLAQVIQDSGADGIRYPSAMEPGGTNVVLFNPAAADIGESRLVEIREVRLEYGNPEDDML